jgi:hypothetical protein
VLVLEKELSIAFQRCPRPLPQATKNLRKNVITESAYYSH